MEKTTHEDLLMASLVEKTTHEDLLIASLVEKTTHKDFLMASLSKSRYTNSINTLFMYHFDKIFLAVNRAVYYSIAPKFYSELPIA